MTCIDNPRLGIQGCGATYGGELQHSVARVTWSTHPDGRAHITGTVNQIDKLWKGDHLRHPDETTGRKALHLDGERLRGLPPEAPLTGWGRSRSDANASEVPRHPENVLEAPRQGSA